MRARDLARAEAAAEGIRKKNFNATAISVDVADRKSVENLAAQTMRKFGQIDILVNSAAMILRKPIEEVTDDEWNAILATNLTGIFISCQVVGREMIKRRQGKIINISSNVAQVLQPGRGAYAVTKAAVSHLTRVLAFEWAPYHINVNAVAPGPTLTEFNQKYFDEHPEDLKARIQSMPLGRMGQPQRPRRGPRFSWPPRPRISSPARRFSWMADRSCNKQETAGQVVPCPGNRGPGGMAGSFGDDQILLAVTLGAMLFAPGDFLRRRFLDD